MCQWQRGSEEQCGDCPEPELLDENSPVISLFNRCTTQFRQGFGGPTGLDYAAVKCAAEALAVDFNEVFDGLQTCEQEYLTMCSEQQKKRDDG